MIAMYEISYNFVYLLLKYRLENSKVNMNFIIYDKHRECLNVVCG